MCQTALRPDRGTIRPHAEGAMIAPQPPPICPLGEEDGAQPIPSIVNCPACRRAVPQMPRMRPQFVELRAVFIQLLRLKGGSYASIGKRLGLTGARVHQIFKTSNAGPRFRPVQVKLRPDAPVTDLPGLTTRETRCIERAGIVTIGQLSQLDDTTILSWPGCGITSLNRVRRALALAGFSGRQKTILGAALFLCCVTAAVAYDWCSILLLEC